MESIISTPLSAAPPPYHGLNWIKIYDGRNRVAISYELANLPDMSNLIGKYVVFAWLSGYSNTIQITGGEVRRGYFMQNIVSETQASERIYFEQNESDLSWTLYFYGDIGPQYVYYAVLDLPE